MFEKGGVLTLDVYVGITQKLQDSWLLIINEYC